MDRALAVPELLRHIFRLCDKSTNATISTVCTVWSEISLDFVWEVSDVNTILPLVGTIASGPGQVRYFSPAPKQKDWRRFQSHYAWRVRTLNAIEMDQSQQCRMPGLFESLCRLQSSKPVFPTLRRLIWRDIDTSGYVHHSVIFMHATLSSFELHMGVSVTVDAVDEYFAAVSERMPHLTSLAIETTQHDVLKIPLFNLVKSLPQLQYLSLPAYSDASETFQEFANAAQLKSLRFSRVTQTAGIQRLDALTNFAVFRDLAELVLHTSYTTFTHFIRHNAAFPALTRLVITSTSQKQETPSAVKDLLEAIENTLPRVDHLEVLFNSVFPPDHIPAPEQSLVDVLHFEHIEPILRRTEMTYFHIMHPFPLSLRQQDIEKIASSWPSIKTLVLCDDPRNDYPGNCSQVVYPDLQVLVPISQYCPKLEHLGLCCNPEVGLTTNEDISSLRHLHTFSPGNVKRTAINHVSVAMFLSQVLPPACRISLTSSWSNPTGSTPAEWDSLWRDVKRGLVLIEAVQDHSAKELNKVQKQLDASRAELESLKVAKKAELN